MAAVLPRNLALIVQRLSNFNRTTIRVRAQSNDTATAGQTISFRLPTNTLVDLHNLHLTGVARAWYLNNATTPQFVKATLPRHINQIFERIDVVINGQVITGNNNEYGCLDHLLRMNLDEGTDAASAARPGSWLNDGPTIRGFSTGTAGANTPVATLAGITGDRFACSQFLGFLGGDYVRFIDTAVLGPVELRFRLASPAILSTAVATGSALPAGLAANAAPNHNFELSDMYMVLDTVSFTDSFYRAILAKRLMEGGILQIPYHNFFSVQKSVGVSGSEFMTFNIASQSIDYLMATFRNNDFNSPTTVGAYGSSTQGQAHLNPVAVDNARYLTTKSISANTELQFMVNNMLSPTWPANLQDQYILTRAAFDLVKTRRQIGKIRTQDEYAGKAFSFVQCFKHHTGLDSPDMIISGLDTRGASSNMALMVKGGGTGTDQLNATVWAICTSTLEVSAGQNIVTIF